MDDQLELAELDALYSSLSPEERDELLQCLLIAASISGETVIQRLEECLLELAGREFIEGLPK
jgi:predicted HAD superfamily phosphohydrolase